MKQKWDSAMHFQLKLCFLTHIMRRKTSVLIAVIFLLTNVAAFCEGTDVEEGKKQGEIDAKSNKLWYLSGCLLPGVGLILPWVFGPTVPSENLIGKSPEYVDAYQKAFVSKVKMGNFLWSLAGFGACVVVVGVGVMEMQAAAKASASCMEKYSHLNPHCLALSPSPGMGLLPQDLLTVIAAP
jgi:hypothetical protein